jgi:LEA14-like dessication related protein
MTTFLLGCAEKVPEPSEENFKTPVVTLNFVDVAHYTGWWYFSPKVKPTKGKAGHNGAPLDYAFIFDISNPNTFPVMLDGFKFLVALDDFDLNSGYATETMWIPAGKTNQLKVEVLFDVRGTILSLGVVAGQKLKAKGVGLMDQVEKFWVGAPDFAFKVHVKEGSAIFKADGLTKVAAFSGTYPQ